MRAASIAVEHHLELNPDDARALCLGAAGLMSLGQQAKALEWAQRAYALDPEDSGILYNVACVYALGGRLHDAMSCLEQAVKNGFGHREWLENDTDLDPLRGEPRFQALVSKL
jgi:Flp pilus assembly protein TadD